jgi:hypothetical protein
VAVAERARVLRTPIELNELNFVWFESKLEQRVAELRSEIKLEIAELRTEFHAGLAALETNSVRWMFAFWAGSTVTTLRTILALLMG